MVLHHHFSLTLAAPSFIADAGFKEPDVLRPLTPQPATSSDQELLRSFLDPHSSSLYLDPISEGSMEPASSEQKKLVPGSIGSPSGEPVNSMNANEVDSYKGQIKHSTNQTILLRPS
ncbi:hypothetical protein PtA15_18A231 [Puccinia triticina]|uniref:Uncharacterized protein n=1 Tax=Puccinia triticina TaxID=208348 RepID=A0ABY7D686_9BASI|nr:uncharacterized protein PtA15_18A231 [Puccinia triticina]WAQ93173.1 hypothetical protein PtA15_18A231 [Puccinia triticina]